MHHRICNLLLCCVILFVSLEHFPKIACRTKWISKSQPNTAANCQMICRGYGRAKARQDRRQTAIFSTGRSPLVSPKPAENRRLPLPFKIQSLSPSGSGSLHFSALRNRARPSPVRWLLALRFVPRRRIRRTQATIKKQPQQK